MDTTESLAVILRLPAEERLAVADAIWASLQDAPGMVPVPDWHLAEIERRLANDGDDAAESWEAVRNRIENGG